MLIFQTFIHYACIDYYQDYDIALVHYQKTVVNNCKKKIQHKLIIIHFTGSQSKEYRIYSGKLLREKTFTNFAILQPPVKIFPIKF